MARKYYDSVEEIMALLPPGKFGKAMYAAPCNGGFLSWGQPADLNVDGRRYLEDIGIGATLALSGKVLCFIQFPQIDTG